MTEDTKPAVDEAAMPQLIALRKLKLSDENVRGKGSKKDDEQLAEDIAAHGILQNLVAVPAIDRDELLVVAGGRRLRALKMLEKAKRIDGDYLVPCLVRKGDDAGEVSLAENFQRVAMNPADEAAAFAARIAEGATEGEIARRFGVTERFVKQRLRLAQLAAPVFEALRAGKISLDLAGAYASIPNVERQAAVFKEYGRDSYSHTPAMVRRRMTDAAITADTAIARYIGEDAYVAAGGRIEADLFADAAETMWIDGDLATRLATEKLTEAADELRGIHGFAELRVMAGAYSPPWNEYSEDGCDWFAGDLPETTGEPLAGEVARRLRVWLTIAADGVPAFSSRARIYPADVEPAEVEVRETVTAPVASAAGAIAAEPEAGIKLSASLVDELAMQRRDVLRAALIGNDDLVADYMVFVLVDRDAHWAGASGSTLQGRPETGPVNFARGEGCPWGSPDWDAFEEELDRSWQESKDIALRFAAFHAMPEAARADWQLYAALRTMEASVAIDRSTASAADRRRPLHDAMAQMIELDPADGWRPTCANYFDRISGAAVKASIVEMLGVPEDEAKPYWAGLKKPELASTAASIAAGTYSGGMPDELRERAKRWVPEAMRFRRLLPVADAAPAEIAEAA